MLGSSYWTCSLLQIPTFTVNLEGKERKGKEPDWCRWHRGPSRCCTMSGWNPRFWPAVRLPTRFHIWPLLRLPPTMDKGTLRFPFRCPFISQVMWEAKRTCGQMVLPAQKIMFYDPMQALPFLKKQNKKWANKNKKIKKSKVSVNIRHSSSLNGRMNPSHV